MKKLILYFTFPMGLFACKYDADKQKNTIPAKPKILAVTLIDYTLSTNASNQIVYYDTAIATDLYNTLSSRSTGTIKIVGVGSNSVQQNITSIDFQQPDTIPLSGIPNVYKKNKTQQQNEQILQRYREQLAEKRNQFIRFSVHDHSEKQSDVTNSLLLCETICSQSNFHGFQKYLIVFSDFLNSTNKPELRPLHLDNVTVICVRPMLSQEALTALFPNCTLHIVTSSQDIASIINNQ